LKPDIFFPSSTQIVHILFGENAEQISCAKAVEQTQTFKLKNTCTQPALSLHTQSVYNIPIHPKMLQKKYNILCF